MTPVLENILEELRREIHKANSPWADLEGAALYCGDCCKRTISLAADAGEIKRHWRGKRPVFRKSDLDRWMESGVAPLFNPSVNLKSKEEAA